MSDKKDRSDSEGDQSGDAGNGESPESAERWDADDERRLADCFAPPKVSCECYCLHCRRAFWSDQIWFQRIVGAPAGELEGFWLCPTSNCDGKGFTFDIFPTDPDHPANDGWVDDDDDEFDEFEDDDDSTASTDDEVEDLSRFNPLAGKRNDEEEKLDPELQAAVERDLEMLRQHWDGSAKEDADAAESNAMPEWQKSPPDQWDPEADAEDVADIIEGDEWKLGLSQAEGDGYSPGIYGSEESRREWEEEQERYNAPDERPREVQWSDHRGSGDWVDEDDIPF